MSFSELVTISYSELKGRILLARQTFKPSQVILIEPPFFIGPKPDGCIACLKKHSITECTNHFSTLFNSFPTILSKIAYIVTETKLSYSRIASLIRIIALFSPMSSSNPNSLTTLLDFQSSTSRNYSAHLTAAKIVHPLLSSTLQSIFSIDVIVKILNILQINAHEYRHGDSCLLFLLGSKIEHSCNPNAFCRIVKNGSLIVKCLRDISPSEAISINYLGVFYGPNFARKARLNTHYDFICTCDVCIGRLPDVFRSCKCPGSSFFSDKCTGIVCPYGMGVSISDWKCLKCKRHLTIKEREKVFLEERSLSIIDPLTIVVDDLLSNQIITLFHHLIFRAITLQSLHFFSIQEYHTAKELMLKGVDIIKTIGSEFGQNSWEIVRKSYESYLNICDLNYIHLNEINQTESGIKKDRESYININQYDRNIYSNIRNIVWDFQI